jgi:hypothetical protein
MKIKTKLMLGVIPCLSTSIVASLASCSNETPNEKEIKKCNYTVKSFQEINNNDIDFYIGPEIKGYVSGKWYIDNFTESFTCEIVSNVDFVGANIYIPK